MSSGVAVGGGGAKTASPCPRDPTAEEPGRDAGAFPGSGTAPFAGGCLAAPVARVAGAPVPGKGTF
jgi:hypothetical protein